MNRRLLLLIVSTTVSNSLSATTIDSEVTNIAGNTWQYSYTVKNDTLVSAIENFTVNFDPNLYTNIKPTTAPSGWNVSSYQPDPTLPSDGVYDALALSGGIIAGHSMTGFTVQFDFLGANTAYSSNSNGNSGSLDAEAGTRRQLGNYIVEPSFGVRGDIISRDAFTESGVGDLPLSQQRFPPLKPVWVLKLAAASASATINA